MAVMACPRRASSATMREPAFPVAPTTAIFMATLQGKIDICKIGIWLVSDGY
jgi:hypothetical protein